MGFYEIAKIVGASLESQNTAMFKFEGGTIENQQLTKRLFKNPTGKFKIFNEMTGEHGNFVGFMHQEILIGFIVKPNPTNCGDHYFFFGRRDSSLTSGVFVGSENYGTFVLEYATGKS